jgi:peptidoglycan/xylan/chitin deacetylase (PgdA/CDA1 family)
MMVSRREFLAGSAAAGVGLLSTRGGHAETAPKGKAQIAITLDLEMSRNFPVWEETRWDYEKGNLNDETKAYAVEAGRRVQARGGIVHFFAVGRVCEQADVDWLKQIAAAGHRIGNHTYDHVNVTATRVEDIQFRFERSPWLIEGREPAQVIRDNIRLCSEALKIRTGIAAAGFRTPGGFANGLTDRPDLQQMLLDLGFTWVSSVYPPHDLGTPMQEPNEGVYAAILAAQAKAQPFRYPSGLVEVPMSPPSDITSFRSGRWKLPWFKEGVRRAVQWAIDHGAAFDFLSHPSCLYVTDPKFETIDMICQMVADAGEKAEIVSVDTLAKRATK